MRKCKESVETKLAFKDIHFYLKRIYRDLRTLIAQPLYASLLLERGWENLDRGENRPWNRFLNEMGFHTGHQTR